MGILAFTHLNERQFLEIPKCTVYPLPARVGRIAVVLSSPWILDKPRGEPANPESAQCKLHLNTGPLAVVNHHFDLQACETTNPTVDG